jgi:hypothetical protein
LVSTWIGGTDAKIGYRALTKALAKAGYKIEGQSS